MPVGREPIVAVYIELAETDRWDDFRWLAESQGLTEPSILELWDSLRARLGRRSLARDAIPVWRRPGLPR
jgi:hypothetical protein